MDELNKLSEIARFLAGEMTKAEQKGFSEWIEMNEANRKLYEDTLVLWDLSGESKEEDANELLNEIQTDRSWGTFEKRLDLVEQKEKEPVKIESSGIIRQLMRLAAVFLIGLGIAYFFLPKQLSQESQLVVHKSNVDQKMEVTLPDGTKVWMNEQTKLTYASDFNPRLLSLEGEAFFEVVHQSGNPFEIRSKKTKTLVLGTSFNVRAYPEETFVEVSVKSGKVAFQENEKKEKSLILKAGDAGTFNEQKQTLVKSDKQQINMASWKTEELNFDNTTMAEAIPTIARYFGKEIKLSNPKLKNCHITGRYHQPTLKQVLDVLAFSLDLKIEEKQNHFILTGKGCELK